MIVLCTSVCADASWCDSLSGAGRDADPYSHKKGCRFCWLLRGSLHAAAGVQVTTIGQHKLRVGCTQHGAEGKGIQLESSDSLRPTGALFPASWAAPKLALKSRSARVYVLESLCLGISESLSVGISVSLYL